MRQNNEADMDVMEQIEAALSEVCTYICKHYEYANEETEHLKEHIGAWGFDYIASCDRVYRQLQKHCEECPLGRISHEFIHSDNT